MAILEACAARGAPLPQAIQNAPDLMPGLDLYYDAYFELQTCRGGMGGPIPWTAIAQYSERLGIEYGEEFDRFVFLIRQMDDEWADYREKKDKKDGKS